MSSNHIQRLTAVQVPSVKLKKKKKEKSPATFSNKKNLEKGEEPELITTDFRHCSAKVRT